MTTTLGQRLRLLRKERRLRLADVAPAAVISISYLNDLEHDRTWPSLHALVRLGTAFDLTSIDLLRGIEPFDRS